MDPQGRTVKKVTFSKIEWTKDSTSKGEERMHKRQHSPEFKLEVVRQVVSGEEQSGQVCREQDPAESVLSRWRKEYQEHREAAFQFQTPVATAEAARIAELEQFCGQLALESAVLKNIAGFEIQERPAMIVQTHQLHPSFRFNGCVISLESARVGTT
ncbi:transposase [Dictyobacter aurantiacus]|uniref:Transposase n=1 Tax=Dictyobacter aurantiacus TaxID=1936993 RepID=A0A401ZQS3_9CHLR|nr:transposase [Dictyobacter aurantiacus]GCE09106.1 hypothetical protein KDAU_64350 [Dictyobacter aurantiacus]